MTFELLIFFTIFSTAEGEDAREDQVTTLKSHSCTYCGRKSTNIGRKSTNIGRHLTDLHKQEADVKKVMSYPISSYERRIAFDALVKKGDFIHNTTVLEEGKGVLIPKYRSVEGANAQYIECEYCNGLYSKHGIRRHQKTCKQK